MIISLLAAGIGIGLGFLFYVKDTRLPDIWAQRSAPVVCGQLQQVLG